MKGYHETEKKQMFQAQGKVRELYFESGKILKEFNAADFKIPLKAGKNTVKKNNLKTKVIRLKESKGRL